jgi:hypothetical protein
MHDKKNSFFLFEISIKEQNIARQDSQDKATFIIVSLFF